MKLRARVLAVGIGGGVLIGAAAVALRHHLNAAAPPAALAEDAGQVRRVVLQYHPQAGPAVAPLYARLVEALSPNVEFVWAAAGADELADLRERMGPAWPADHSRAVFVGKPISTWSKDRFVALADGPDGPAVLLAPARERAALDVRTNDQEVPYALGREAPELFACRGLPLHFDGGDFLVTGRAVFAHPALLEKNAASGDPRFDSLVGLGDYLAGLMGRPIVWLADRPADAPPHHVGMFLTVTGQTAVVGDVRLADRLAAGSAELAAVLESAGGPATREQADQLAAQCDRIAARMAELGCRVVRVPLVPSAGERAWLSYNNGLVETRDGRTIFYMPTFGVAPLDRAAAETFGAVGCRVVEIDCSDVWALGGSLRCLTNVTERRPR